MGCHTWFSRPITDEEFEKMKENAPSEIYYLTGDSKKNIEIGLYDKNLYDLLMKSYNENIPCVYGFYWWQLGYGSGLDNTYHEIGKCSKLYTDVLEYYDTFRIFNYPRKIIRSRRDLRRFLRKRYFELTDKQLERVSQFLENIQVE